MVTIKSIRKLEDSEIESIKKEFKVKKEEEVKLEIDKNLIGGIIVRKDGEMFDGSVKGQLEKLREKLYARVI
jgi:F-type H+-transporting ATPase subunit delta